jgi:ATP-dependent HslUV protease ATP-binding subunit HslU
MKLDTIIDIGDALNQSKNPPPDFIVKLVEERGIVFIDEFDKIFLDSRGENVGNMGVVRDLMPYLDGVVTEVSTVNERERGGGLFGERNEKYIINTANILWIASGAFHLAKVSDVPAEILGRLPVHVKLNRLTADDLEKVLIKPHGSIIAGVTLLMSAEGAEFVIDAAAIRAIADLAYECNTVGEDTGARRLKGVCFELFRDMLYGASNLLPDQKKVHFTAEQVMAERERILATVERRKEKPKETDPAQRFAKAMKELGTLVNN